MVQETTWCTIWRVDWTNEAPSLRQKLPDCRCLHLREVLASMNTSEMGEVPGEVKLVSDNCEAGGLLHIELGSCD